MPTLPLTFENPTINYTINSFGGPNFEPIPAEVTTNPDIGGLNTSPTVLHINKPESAQWWAGAGYL